MGLKVCKKYDRTFLSAPAKRSTEPLKSILETEYFFGVYYTHFLADLVTDNFAASL
jgi:hypothetical protein